MLSEGWICGSGDCMCRTMEYYRDGDGKKPAIEMITTNRFRRRSFSYMHTMHPLSVHIGDGAQLEILKHAAAGADGNAQVLVLIAARIPLLQRLGLLEKPSPCD